MQDRLTKLARDQACVRCGSQDGTVVCCHYFGARRHAYHGGMGCKGDSVIAAHLCHACHAYMDTASKSKETRWLHSEEFLHLCALTIVRLFEQGKLKVSK